MANTKQSQWFFFFWFLFSNNALPGDFIFLTCHPTGLLCLCYSSWFCVFMGFLYLFVFLITGVSDLCQLYLYSYTSIWNYCFIFRWKVIIKFYKILFHLVLNSFIFINVCCVCVCFCEEHMPHVSGDFEHQKNESDFQWRNSVLYSLQTLFFWVFNVSHPLPKLLSSVWNSV